MSVKQWQSEVGMTGDPSPNVELLLQISALLEKFEHNHGNITKLDCYVLISSVCMGQKLIPTGNPRENQMVLGELVGCNADLAAAMCGFLMQNEHLIEIFEVAVTEARRLLLFDGLDNDETLN